MPLPPQLHRGVTAATAATAATQEDTAMAGSAADLDEDSDMVVTPDLAEVSDIIALASDTGAGTVEDTVSIYVSLYALLVSLKGNNTPELGSY